MQYTDAAASENGMHQNVCRFCAHGRSDGAIHKIKSSNFLWSNNNVRMVTELTYPRQNKSGHVNFIPPQKKILAMLSFVQVSGISCTNLLRRVSWPL